MRIIKRLIKSRFVVVWAMCGAILFLTSFCTKPQEPTSGFESEEYSYTSYEEKPLTSENSGQSAYNSEAVEPEQQQPLHYDYTEEEIDMLAKLVCAEAGGCSADEQRLVIWTVFQRVDSADWDFRNMNDITAVVTAPNQFAYSQKAPIIESIRAICAEEISKWANFENPPTLEPYAPSLPYYFFEGDGYHNWFRAEW